MQARGEAPAATKTVPRVITAGRVPLSVTLRRRDDGKWYLLASFPRNDLPGAIAQPTAWMGVDLNADSVAHAVMQMVAGEPVLLSYRKDTFSLSDSKAHRTERLYRIVNALVADAKQNGWGVSLEYLDFEHCKSWLKTKLGALLHLFPYLRCWAWSFACAGRPWAGTRPPAPSLRCGRVKRATRGWRRPASARRSPHLFPCG
jgi:hypothetical protein